MNIIFFACVCLRVGAHLNFNFALCDVPVCVSVCEFIRFSMEGQRILGARRYRGSLFNKKPNGVACC